MEGKKLSSIAKGAVKGQVAVEFTSVTADYTVLTTDEFLQVDTTAGAVAVSLPDPSTMTGQTVRVQRTAGSNNVTVDGSSPQYIRVAGKSVLTANGSQVAYASDGSYWNNLGTVS